MRIKFWGVRGSCPTPLTSEKLQSRIAAVVQRIEKTDLETPEDRERFIASLPEHILNTVGGNTTCIEIRSEDNTVILFDAGSGIREYSTALKKRREKIDEYHIFFTHFHWDHLQGLPFFLPAYDKNVTLHFYSPVENLEEILQGQMVKPYFPITMNAMAAKVVYHRIDDEPIRIGSISARFRKVKHPGDCISYKLTENGKSMVFSTDTELTEIDFSKTEENTAFYQNTDLIIMDSQYTLDEAIEKYDWGHSSYSLSVDFAKEWGIKKLILFHHEPTYDDGKMYRILKSARWDLNHLTEQDLRIDLATEGMEITL